MVNCLGCGFMYGLAHRGQIGSSTKEAVEVTVDHRPKGQNQNELSGSYADRRGFCQQRRDEIDIGNQLSVEHDCPEFEPYVPGLSAQSHWKMKHDRWLLEREDKRDQVMREREDKRDITHSTNERMNRILVILTILAILATAFIPRCT